MGPPFSVPDIYRKGHHTAHEIAFLNQQYQKSKSRRDYTGLRNYIAVILSNQRSWDRSIDVAEIRTRAEAIRAQINIDELQN